MTLTSAENIEDFCAYFYRQAAAIGRVTIAPLTGDMDGGAGSEFLYRKVLWVSAIDTLAGLRYNTRQNRERFMQFVEEHGSWPEGALVSIPFLRDKLEKLELLQYPLGQYVTARLSTFSTEDGGALPVSRIDESASELLALSSTKEEAKAVCDCQHRALLYRYRNSLVHESREPGNGMEIFKSSGDPYYHGYIDDPKWYLVYPSLLFESLLERAIASFQTYLISNSIDPYSLVEDRARW